MPETGALKCRTGLTVVIAAGESQESLHACLAGLAQQTVTPATYDVVVVRYDTRAGVLAFGQVRTPFALTSLPVQATSAAAALNAGIAIAAGEFCLLLSDDGVPDCELVARHLAVQRERGGVISLGRITSMALPEHDWCARARLASRDHVDARAAACPTWRDCDHRNFCAPTEALRACGGFAFGSPLGAADLAFRLGRLGTSLVHIPEAVLACEDRRSGAALVADAERRGMDSLRLAGREPAMLAGLVGAFAEGGWREAAVRRLLLALRVTPRSVLALAAWLRTLAGSARCSAFALRYAFWSGVRRQVNRDGWCRITRGTPILMYHAFARRGERVGRYVIARRRFVVQMLALRLLRYRVVGLDELVQPGGTDSLPPRRAAVITIDDGYLDNYEIALPILKRFRYPATVFLVSSRVGQTNDWDPSGELSGRLLLDWGRIRKMAGTGVRLGAHTMTHPHLPRLTAADARQEVGGSRRELLRSLGGQVDALAFPYGEWDPNAVQAARQAGFLGACSTRPRRSYPDGRPFLIDRIEIRGSDSLLAFLCKIAWGASWSRRP